MARSAACRFAMGALNVTTRGCATPTTSPGVGRTDAIANLDDWLAARLTPAGLATTVAPTTVPARRQRTTARMGRPLLLDTVPIGIVGGTEEWKRRGAFAIRSRLGHVSTTAGLNQNGAYAAPCAQITAAASADPDRLAGQRRPEVPDES